MDDIQGKTESLTCMLRRAPACGVLYTLCSRSFFWGVSETARRCRRIHLESITNRDLACDHFVGSFHDQTNFVCTAKRSTYRAWLCMPTSQYRFPSSASHATATIRGNSRIRKVLQKSQSSHNVRSFDPSCPASLIARATRLSNLYGVSLTTKLARKGAGERMARTRHQQPR